MTKKQKKVEKKLLGAICNQSDIERVNIAVRSCFDFISACGNMEEHKRRSRKS